MLLNMKPLYKHTATWEGYQESLCGTREPADIDKLLDWLSILRERKAAARSAEVKMNLELEREATHRILDIIVNAN